MCLKSKAYFDKRGWVTNQWNTLDKEKHEILISELIYSTKDRLVTDPIAEFVL